MHIDVGLINKKHAKIHQKKNVMIAEEFMVRIW